MEKERHAVFSMISMGLSERTEDLKINASFSYGSVFLLFWNLHRGETHPPSTTGNWKVPNPQLVPHGQSPALST